MASKIKKKRSPIEHGRPPIFRSPFSQLQQEQAPPWQQVPPWFTGSGAEWAVYWALMQLKVQFQYQANELGGRQLAGGAVADFEIPDIRTIIRVQGIHWHYGMGSARIASDDLQKLQLIAQGFQVIDIDEDDALRDPRYFVQRALEGQDLSRATRGI